MTSESNPTLRVIDIIPGTSVDGPGLRTSVYLAGCHHQCPGCHNPQSWDPLTGTEMSANDLIEVIEENGFNVTFTGGDPLYQADALIPVIRELKRRGKNIWLYTGFLYEEALRSAAMAEVINLIDVLVDGPFMMALRDPSLRFRGSSNQRLIITGTSHPGNIDTYPEHPSSPLDA